MEMNQKSILEMARGAIRERVDYEMSKIVNNILDPNTVAQTARKLTVTLTLKPNEKRDQIAVSSAVSCKLAPTNEVSTQLYVEMDEDGLPVILEGLPQLPGQTSLADTVGGRLHLINKEVTA